MTETNCDYCQDAGMVILEGRAGPRTPNGTLRYERGAAPCRWCDTGTNTYAHLRKLGQQPADNYTVKDLAAPSLKDETWKKRGHQ